MSSSYDAIGRTQKLGAASYRALGVPSWASIHDLTRGPPSPIAWLHTFRALVALRAAYDELKAKLGAPTTDDLDLAWAEAFDDATSVDAAPRMREPIIAPSVLLSDTLSHD
jgi:hypothetical protein